MDPKKLASLSQRIADYLEGGVAEHGPEFAQLVFSAAAERAAVAFRETLPQYLRGQFEITAALLGDQPGALSIH